MKFEIAKSDLPDRSDSQPAALPKYASQILNLANQNAQGTIPKVVGQVTSMFQRFPGKTLREWEELGLVENVDAAIESLIVERPSTSVVTIDILTQPDLVNQFRIARTLMQFIL